MSGIQPLSSMEGLGRAMQEPGMTGLIQTPLGMMVMHNSLNLLPNRGYIRIIPRDRSIPPYAVDQKGNRVSVTDALPSTCGAIFDAYVLRALPPFPYSRRGPSSRTIGDLWNGRRLKIFPLQKNKANTWKSGRIVQFYQWCSGPYSSNTNWKVKISLNDDVDGDETTQFSAGDIIKIQGLKNAKQHNGKEATVHDFDEATGRFRVEYREFSKDISIRDILDGKRTEEITSIFLGLKPQNMVHASEIDRDVHRLNTEGGGTLVGSHGDTAPLISFEWSDPPWPIVDFNDGSIAASCPICRAVEVTRPSMAPQTVETECPVCLEDKPCRVLHCTHAVCNSCWGKWKGTPETSEPSRSLEPLETLNMEEIEMQRSEILEEYSLVSHTWVGPPDCDSTGRPIDTPRRRAFGKWTKKLSKELVKDANSGARGLSEFRRKLMVYPMIVWFHALADFIDSSKCMNGNTDQPLSISAMEIMIEVLEFRYANGCVEKELMWHEAREEPGSQLPMDAQTRFAEWATSVCMVVGEMCEQVLNFRAEIFWFQKALKYARLSFKAHRNDFVGTALYNLAIAYMYAGYLETSLGYYEEAFSVMRSYGDKRIGTRGNNCDRLLREMQNWKGTLGRMPRDDTSSYGEESAHVCLD